MAYEDDFDEPYMTQKIGHVTIFSFLNRFVRKGVDVRQFEFFANKHRKE